MITSHNYYAGAKDVDGSKMRSKAAKEAREGIPSWVHAHAYNGPCNASCVLYTENGEQHGV